MFYELQNIIHNSLVPFSVFQGISTVMFKKIYGVLSRETLVPVFQVFKNYNPGVPGGSVG